MLISPYVRKSRSKVIIQIIILRIIVSSSFSMFFSTSGLYFKKRVVKFMKICLANCTSDFSHAVPDEECQYNPILEKTELDQSARFDAII